MAIYTMFTSLIKFRNDSLSLPLSLNIYMAFKLLKYYINVKSKHFDMLQSWSKYNVCIYIQRHPCCLFQHESSTLLRYITNLQKCTRIMTRFLDGVIFTQLVKTGSILTFVFYFIFMYSWAHIGHLIEGWGLPCKIKPFSHGNTHR